MFSYLEGKKDNHRWEKPFTWVSTKVPSSVEKHLQCAACGKYNAENCLLGCMWLDKKGPREWILWRLNDDDDWWCLFFFHTGIKALLQPCKGIKRQLKCSLWRMLDVWIHVPVSIVGRQSMHKLKVFKNDAILCSYQGLEAFEWFSRSHF